MERLCLYLHGVEVFRIKAKVTGKTKPNVVFLPFHFFEAAANVLTIDALDPVCKIPEYKVCSCKIEKVYP